MLLNIFNLIIITFFVNIYKRFPFPYSFVNGTPNIYLTPKFYLTDILLILLPLIALTLKVAPSLKGFAWRKPVTLYDIYCWGRDLVTREFFPFLLLVGFTLAGALSKNVSLSFYSLARLGLYLYLFYCVRSVLGGSKQTFRTALFLTVPVLAVSILAMLQWREQRYVWGFFPFGEPLFSPSFANSPLVNYLGTVRLRAFGTFPHPNILGGFLAVSLVWIIDGFLNSLRKGYSHVVPLYQFSVILLGLFALFVSFSQGAWAAFILGVVLYVLISLSGGQRPRFRVTYLIVSFAILLFSFSYIYKLPFEAASTRRHDLIKTALNLWWTHPVVGVGPGNFVALSSYYWKEPVHNIYLLVLSETGIVGFLPFIFLLSYCLRNSLKKVFWDPLPAVLLVEVLFLGLFDHYLFTSAAGSLIFWIVLGMAASRSQA